MLGSDELREIFQRTKIVRKPTYGIISGYHTLPYVCLGAAFSTSSGTMQVRGKVHVSPRLIIRPSHFEPSYDEIFGEDNVDGELTGRIFGFMGFKGKPVECKSEHLEVSNLDMNMDSALSRTLDDLERNEDITTGVIITPNSRYYPVSIERFITTILDDEFSVGS